MKLEEIVCYNCGTREYDLFDRENGYNLVKCSKCGLLYVNPRPSLEEIQKSLITGLHQGEQIINFTGNYHAIKVKKYLRILNEFYPKNNNNLEGKKWLDIGCGFGELLEALKIHTKNSLIVKGMEPNEAKIAFAKAKGLDVSNFEMESHTEKYDFISLLNVYSHIPEPVRYIDNLKKNLKPDGEILLQTGHTCHIPVKHYRRPYQLPDHLHFANQEIVENIFNKLGFNVLHKNTYRYEFFPFTFNLLKFTKEIIRVFLRRRKNFRGLIPRFPKQDMFMRAKLNKSSIILS